MLKFVCSLAGFFIIFAVCDDAKAHHSWKCPPDIDVKVVGIEQGNRFTLAITARNTCGCSILFKACPIESESEDAAECRKAWVVPGGYFRGKVLTGSSSGKANFDWRTHSNDAPCT